MRLKPIKSGMAINCKNDTEYEQLNAEVIKLGYGSLPCQERSNNRVIQSIVFCVGTVGVGWEYVCDFAGEYIEFSDLILPELSAEEVLEICHKICKGKSCNECLMRKNCFAGDEPDFKKVVEICEKWKAENSQKEPEVEWADICRIIQIEESGVKKCVHEQTMKNYENAEDEAGNILKWYVAENVGNYIAVVERVCRVRQ